MKRDYCGFPAGIVTVFTLAAFSGLVLRCNEPNGEIVPQKSPREVIDYNPYLTTPTLTLARVREDPSLIDLAIPSMQRYTSLLDEGEVPKNWHIDRREK